MDAFFRSIPVLLIFPTLVALTWIRGGTHGDLLVPTVPWLLTLVFEVLICFPQRHYGEDAVQARQRCWRRIGRDPVFFLTLLFCCPRSWRRRLRTRSSRTPRSA